ncbi:MAG: hypothetical protein QOF72_501, partial [Blastocatellia bacterium]|nr:hypothetical protein [Blastocatellia bacterium]
MTCPSRLSCYSLILAALVCTSGIVQGQTPDAKSKGTGSIAGRVTVGAKGASGITVGAFGGDIYPRRAAVQTTTDSEGRYRLFGLAPGTYQVSTLAPTLVTGATNNSPYGTGKMILLAASESVEDVDFKLSRGAVITGRITDEEGKPVIEERVNLEPVVPPGGPNMQMSQQY